MALVIQGIKRSKEIYEEYCTFLEAYMSFRDSPNRASILAKANEAFGDYVCDVNRWYPAANTTFYTDGHVPIVRLDTPSMLLHFTADRPIPRSVTFTMWPADLSKSPTTNLYWEAAIYHSTTLERLAVLTYANKTGSSTEVFPAGKYNCVYNFSADPDAVVYTLLGQASTNVYRKITCYLDPVRRFYSIGNDFKIGVTSKKSYGTGNYTNAISLRELYLTFY